MSPDDDSPEAVALARLKLARNRACRQCNQYIFRNARGWNWERCWAMGKDAHGIPNTELSSEVMGGPEETCPNGGWAGVQGQTQEQVDVEHTQETHDHAVRLVNYIRPLLSKPPSKAIALMALEEMVNAEPPYNLAAELRDAMIIVGDDLGVWPV